MKQHLALSHSQAGALARLIRNQLAAYDDAFSGPGEGKSARRKIKPFTSRDLDLIEPLLEMLEKHPGS